MTDRSQRQAPWAPEAKDFIEKHNLSELVSVEHLEELLDSQTALWKGALDSGRSCYFLRLHVPLVEREEVLTGNLLFGDYVRKCTLEALKAKGDALSLAGDLDDAYYLAVSSAEADELALAVREYIQSRLVELFFGEEDPGRGIHGNPEEMFGFTASFIEPYPVFAVPDFLARDLYGSMLGVLSEKLDEKPLVVTDPKNGARRVTRDLRNIQSTFAFFFGRTADNKGDVPGFAGFLFRLVTVYELLEVEEVVEALRLAEFDRDSFRETKDSIKKSFDGATLDEEKTRELFQKLLKELRDAKAKDAEPEHSWFLPYIRKDGKLLDASPEDYMDSILDGAFLGFASLGEAERGEGLACRVCGTRFGPIGEKNIILGKDVGKFYNQSGNTKKAASANICSRCALFSFLNTKLFGMTSAGKFPVPSRENLIFHYGYHDESGLRRLDRLANKTIELARQFKDVRRKISEENKKLEDAERRVLDAEWEANKLRELAAAAEDPNTGEDVGDLLVELFQGKPLVEQTAAAMGSNGKIKVFSLGAERQRIIIFALPHFRDELELADRRFSKNRSTVLSLMAFLSDLCGCDGPFFFQGKPRLEASDEQGTFYIRDRAYDSERYRRRYEALSKFAYDAVGGRPSDALEGRLKLAIELEEAPLATFDSVLRDSPIRVGEKASEAKYRRALNEDGKAEYDTRLRVYSPWQYLGFFEEMRKLEKEEHLGNS